MVQLFLFLSNNCNNDFDEFLLTSEKILTPGKYMLTIIRVFVFLQNRLLRVRIYQFLGPRSFLKKILKRGYLPKILRSHQF